MLGSVTVLMLVVIMEVNGSFCCWNCEKKCARGKILNYSYAYISLPVDTQLYQQI